MAANRRGRCGTPKPEGAELEEQSPERKCNADDASNSGTLEIGNPVSRKRMRVYEGLRHNTASNTDHWNKAECSSKMQQISRQLQDARGAVSKLLNLQTTTSNQGPITSCLVEKKIYGRSADMKYILKLMKEDNTDGVTVLPIVGIGGVGKTTLAQFAYSYNDQDVKNLFDHRIWVSVSNNFDEVTLMKDILDYFSQEKHEGVNNFIKLQDKLKPYVESKRFLVIFDDVWDSMDSYIWDKLLALFTNNAQRSVFLVTTRSLSVAKMVGTVEPIELGSLEHNDFWLLFKARSFGDEKYNRHPTLINIGLKIVEKLHGNPLAAETAGMLLRKHLTIEHWNNILQNEEWKSLQLSRGIMVSLKRSYDFLPNKQLQRCFGYFCFFPHDTIFYDRVELISCWIAQGFVQPGDKNQKLEDIGNKYFDDLVDSGLFLTNKSPYPERIFMHDLMLDLAWEVGRTEFATIDGSDCQDILPTIRHLSIVGISDLCGTTLSRENFDKKMKKITSVKKLRSLVLIDFQDRHLFKHIQSIIKEACSLRMLKIGANHDDTVSTLSNLGNCTHLRYLKIWTWISLNNIGIHEGLLIPLSKFYHLEVFDAKRAHKVDGMSNLVNMRYLAVTMGALSSGSSVGEMREHQDVHDFTDQNSSCIKIAQIQPMNKLVKLYVFQLENGNEAEVYEAKLLRDKDLLETLYLSWKDTKNGQSSDRAKDMLEGLEPHHHLKHLYIIGYNGATSPKWLATSVTCLQTLHLEGSKEWQRLPSLKSLLLLKKLKLVNMQKVKEVSIPSLEELILCDMPKLERCSCSSVRDLNSMLRVLEMRQCHELKAFPLFEGSVKLKVPQDSWMPCLVKIAIIDCPHLVVSYPLPPSNVTAELYIGGVPTLPSMFTRKREELEIKLGGLGLLDHRILAFSSLSLLSELEIDGCGNTTYVMLACLRQLISLRLLHITRFREFLPLDVVQEDTHEGMAAIGPPYLKHLRIDDCGIKGSLLSGILRNVQALEELDLEECHLTGLSLEENQSSLPNLVSPPEASSAANPFDTWVSSVSDGFLCIPSNVISSLKRLRFDSCGDPTFYGCKDSFARFTSLEYLEIWEGPKFFSSLLHKAENNKQANGRWLLPDSLVDLGLRMKLDPARTEEIPCFPDTLQICFPGNQTRLKELTVWGEDLKSLQLHACTALQELAIRDCELLADLEGLQLLGFLRHLTISGSSNILPCLERHATQGCDLLSQLESLEIDAYSVLTTSFCKHLTSLQCLQFVNVDALSSEVMGEESVLQLLTSLEELYFLWCHRLAEIPVGLHCLPSLQKLVISSCPNILKLPEIGLPTLLEELEIIYCSEELSEQCRALALAESQPKVKIDHEYVN